MIRMMTGALAAAMMLGATGTALAAPSTLQLIVGGEAYDGPPRFEVSFDGEVVGEAAVDVAIDTGTAGRFADAADKSPYVQSFSFAIPEALFAPGGEVRVRLVNEAYGGDGSNRDRNLFLAAVTVNGRAVTVSGLSTRGTSAAVENEQVGEFLVLRDGNIEGVSRAPAGGWPLPESIAELAPETAPVIASEARAAADAEAEVAPVEATPVPKAPAVVAAVELPTPRPAGIDAIETASLAPGVETMSPTSCTRDELYNVVGFNENSNDLTPRLEARLDQIIADIGAQKCRVLVTGYSSRQGAHATNALFAIERAQNVLGYLKANGLSYEKAIAAGAGATAQFGPTFSANRRVVITVTP
ncbi:OmpA family protein [Devosia sp.]|uniref:OmpA family protein n=1 Tax=Devosia sp. TaxID=1871048 RepID=UPI0035B095EB